MTIRLTPITPEEAARTVPMNKAALAGADKAERERIERLQPGLIASIESEPDTLDAMRDRALTMMGLKP